MNPIAEQDIRDFDNENLHAEQEQRLKIETPIIADGNAINALINTQGWQVLVRDLTAIKTDLINTLKNPKLNMTKEQMKLLQVRILDIETFIETPQGYVERLKELRVKKYRGNL